MTQLRVALASVLGSLVFSGTAVAATFDVNWAFGTTSNLAIDVGDTVRWTWGDPLPHNVTTNPAQPESFASGTSTGAGTQFQHTFTAVGTTSYFCSVHSQNMTGSVTVTAPPVPVLPGVLLWTLSGALGLGGLVGARRLRRGVVA